MGKYAVLVAILGLAACGSVESNGGNDVPSGPAVPSVADSTAGCTHNGEGINATVMPRLSTSGSAVQGQIGPLPDGIDTAVPSCLDNSAPELALEQVAFVIKDGVLQAPASNSNVTMVVQSQWFSWNAPMPSICSAEVEATVNVTAGSTPTCGVELQFGAYVDAPIGTYATSAS